MKIKGRCRTCDRDFPVDVLLASQSAGHCPFCGTALDAHYGAMLVNSLTALQRAGSAMGHALEQLSQFGPNFDLDDESVLEPIRTALAQRPKG